MSTNAKPLADHHQRGQEFFRLPRGFKLIEPNKVEMPSLKLIGIEIAMDNFQSVVQLGEGNSAKFWLLHTEWLVRVKPPKAVREEKVTNKASKPKRDLEREVAWLLSLPLQ